MKIYIAGIGMDGADTLTAQAARAIASADILIGSKRAVSGFDDLKKRVFYSWQPDEIRKIIEQNKKDISSAVILMSGDCGFYSGAAGLVSALKGYDTQLISGISSPVYFFSKLKKPWQDTRFISLHGTQTNIVRNVCKNRYCFFLLGGKITPSDVCQKLCGYGMGEVKVYIGQRLAYDDEKIYIGKAEDFTRLECDPLCVMLTENDEYERYTPVGISDNNFIRGGVPMTRAEIRAAVISKLCPRCDDICWDIGCGTGSVTVELALHCCDGTVFSADDNAEAVLLTEKNVKKFGCDNVKISCAHAPEILGEFPAPDKVFIGGSRGSMSGIVSAVLSKNPRAVIAATAVSIETVSEIISAFKENGIDDPEILQLAVTRTKRLGSHTVFAAENPVFLIKGERV